MIGLILGILGVLWVLGYVRFQGMPDIPDYPLFLINGYPVRFWELLILVVIGFAITVIPSPFKQIAGVLLLIWILSTIGILAIPGLASIIVLAIIGGLVLMLLGVK